MAAPAEYDPSPTMASMELGLAQRLLRKRPARANSSRALLCVGFCLCVAAAACIGKDPCNAPECSGSACAEPSGLERTLEWKRGTPGEACMHDPSSSGSISMAADAAAGPPPGTVADAARVVEALRKAITQCYRTSLGGDRCEAGQMLSSLHIDCAGSVEKIDAKVRDLSDSTVGCTMSVLREARFAPLEGGTAIIQIPFRFVRPGTPARR